MTEENLKLFSMQFLQLELTNYHIDLRQPSKGLHNNH